MNTDNTILDQNQQFVNNTNSDSESTIINDPVAAKSGMGTPCKVILGATGGILLGTVGAFAASHLLNDDDASSTTNHFDGHDGLNGSTDKSVASVDETNDEVVNTEEAPDVDSPASIFNVSSANVAQGDYNHLDYDSAFDAARAEVGPGGVFEWNGNYYTTFTNEEWTSLSEADRAEYAKTFETAINDNFDENFTDEEIQELADDVVVEPETPAEELADFDITVAHNVDDSMSFNTAFANARAEVGPGGVFEWRGNYYNTFYAEEWDQMSSAEHDQFRDDFADLLHGSTHPVPSPTPSDFENLADGNCLYVEEVEGQQIAYVEKDGNIFVLIDEDGDGEFDTAYCDLNNDDEFQSNEMVNIQDQHYTTDMAYENLMEDVDVPEDEIASVEHHVDADGNEYNTAEVVIEGENYELYDNDNDQVFETAGHDDNGDGEITTDEIFDIAEQNISVDDLGGFTDGVADNNRPSVTVEQIDLDGDIVNIATISGNGEEAHMIDSDNDGRFDHLIYDENHDGEISENEIINIEEYNVTVDDMNDVAEALENAEVVDDYADNATYDYHEQSPIEESYDDDTTDQYNDDSYSNYGDDIYDSSDIQADVDDFDPSII